MECDSGDKTCQCRHDHNRTLSTARSRLDIVEIIRVERVFLALGCTRLNAPGVRADACFPCQETERTLPIRILDIPAEGGPDEVAALVVRHGLTLCTVYRDTL